MSPPSSIVSMKYLKIPSGFLALVVIHQAGAILSTYVPSSLIGLIAIRSVGRPLDLRFVINVLAHVPAQYENTPDSEEGSVEKNLLRASVVF